MKTNKNQFRTIKLNILILLSIVSINANAGIIYATDGGSDSRTLYKIDSHSGEVTTIGSIGYSVADIGWDRTTNTLYGVTKTRNRRDDLFEGLISINTKTGTGTEIGRSSPRITQVDIDSKGNMYGSDGFTIYRINKTTGIATEEHPVTVNIDLGGDNTFQTNASLGKYGLSFDNSDLLWTTLGVENNRFGSTDMETGISSITANLIPPKPNITYTGGITLEGDSIYIGRHGTFNPETNLYWVLLNNTITKYDMSTGNIMGTLDLVNAPPAIPNPFQANQGIRSLAFASPVPLPAAFWLFSSALAGILGFSNRNSRKA